MLTVPHAAVGATIAYKIPNPLLSLPLALLSHFFLDFFIPHWNPHLYTEYHKKGSFSKTTQKIILIDGVLALILVSLIASLKLPNPVQSLYVILGAGFGVLPDVFEIPYYFLSFKNRILASYVDFEHQYQRKSSFLPGLLTQIVTVLICLFILST